VRSSSLVEQCSISTSAVVEEPLQYFYPHNIRSRRRRIVILRRVRGFVTARGERDKSKMSPSPPPSLPEVIRQLLPKIEETSYPNNDPSSIESLKAHLRCRIVELEVEQGSGPLPLEIPERPPLRYGYDWWLPRSQLSRSISQESLSEKEDRPVRNKRILRSELSLAK
jgi:hypothetical protein